METRENIKGFEGYYEVSNLGNIKSIERTKKNHSKYIRVKEKLLTPNDRGDGIMRVNLWKNGIQKQYKVHRLVCSAFLDNLENKRTVNHKDGNRHNNTLENLEWATDGENILHSYRTLGRKSGMLGRKGLGRSIKIVKKDLQGNIVEEYLSIRQAEIQNNLHNIYLCVVGKNKSVGGFIRQRL